MYVRHLSLADFRNYESAEVPLGPGVTTFLGLNGHGKTNLLEAIGYVSALASHRVAQDAPLVRHGAPRAVVRVAVVRQARESLAEVEITPGRANRARLNRQALGRPRDLLGALRTVLFAPEDLALVKGEPAERRRFLDDLLVQRQPRWAGVRVDYERALRQRNALLKSAALPPRAPLGRQEGGANAQVDESQVGGADAPGTLEVWDEQLAGIGAQLLYARLRLLRDLAPLFAEAYESVSATGSSVVAHYQAALPQQASERVAAGEVPGPEDLREQLLSALGERRAAELKRGYTMAGPHRDDVVLQLGDFPAKGFASHGESWSLALALRLAAFGLLRRDLADDPVLVLDDVFAELDGARRTRLASLVGVAEQVLVSAAVPQDVPEQLRGTRYQVDRGAVEREDPDG